MNVGVVFVPFDQGPELDKWRSQYLDSLPHAQEPLLEMFVPSASAYRIVSKGVNCGYLLVHKQAALIEFYLRPTYWVFAEPILKKAVSGLRLTSAIVKSFDSLFFSAAVELQIKIESMGILGRDFIKRELPSIERIKYTKRLASESDLPSIRSIEQDVFSSAERLQIVIEANELWLFEQDSTLVGFGIIRPIVAGKPDVELGIALAPAFRNKGYAIYIFRDLFDMGIARGLNPVAGCARSNAASRSMAERIGMVSRHRLLELSFPEIPAVGEWG